MRVADQFEYEGEKSTPERCMKMYCAAWRMSPRSQVFIGAPNLDALEAIWREITGGELDRERAQFVRVYDVHNGLPSQGKSSEQPLQVGKS